MHSTVEVKLSDKMRDIHTRTTTMNIEVDGMCHGFMMYWDFYVNDDTEMLFTTGPTFETGKGINFGFSQAIKYVYIYIYIYIYI